MKHIMVFCIPAHGHHNPTLPVVKALVERGNAVRYYSFEEFREKVEQTGAGFIACDRFLPELSEEQEKSLKSVSTTEMTVVDLQTTARMDGFLKEQVEEFQPDVIFTDSVCFWGKLTARKYGIPMVVSTSTFAFNRSSSQYMKSSFAEIKDLIRGSKRVKAELKALEQYGYHEKSIMPLVRNDNYTDTVVYATEAYQPCAETFSAHYAFVGPSLFTRCVPNKTGPRPLVLISLGTVINERPGFYEACIRALRDVDADVLLVCGNAVDPARFEPLPENIQVCQHIDQPEVLSRARAFLTHCGMNSVSESLYMATPMVLFPQTNEQRAVARRVRELGAGAELKSEGEVDIKKAVLAVLNDETYSAAAQACSRDFRAAPGPEGAAAFIESAPHRMPEADRKSVVKELLPGLAQLLFWLIAVPMIVFLPRLVSRLSWWHLAIAFNVLFIPFKKLTARLARQR